MKLINKFLVFVFVFSIVFSRFALSHPPSPPPSPNEIANLGRAYGFGALGVFPRDIWLVVLEWYFHAYREACSHLRPFPSLQSVFRNLSLVSSGFRRLITGYFNGGPQSSGAVHRNQHPEVFWHQPAGTTNFLPVTLNQGSLIRLLDSNANFRDYAINEILRRTAEVGRDMSALERVHESFLRLGLVHCIPRRDTHILRLAAFVIDVEMWAAITDQIVHQVYVQIGAQHAQLPRYHFAYERITDQAWSRFGRNVNPLRIAIGRPLLALHLDVADVLDLARDRIRRLLRNLPAPNLRIHNQNNGRSSVEENLNAASYHASVFYQLASIVVRYRPEFSELLSELSAFLARNGVTERQARRAFMHIRIPESTDRLVRTQLTLLRLLSTKISESDNEGCVLQ